MMESLENLVKKNRERGLTREERFGILSELSARGREFPGCKKKTLKKKKKVLDKLERVW